MAEASAPPRIVSQNGSLRRKSGGSSLDILLQMGFPKQRCIKALAATGDRGVQLASDWLISHVNDQTLDKDEPREYILYLCPVGSLQMQLTTFWEKSLMATGWNRAHNYFPHMTLCSFFKVEDKKLPILTESIEALEPELQKAPGKLQFDFFSHPQKGYIGLMASQNSPYNAFLEGILSRISSQVRSAGIVIGNMKKSLHITLAHHYPQENHQRLEKLAQEIDLNAEVRWSLRLYSRDARLATAKVHKVLKSYQPILGDELEMVEGDFIFLTPGQSSLDGWFQGTSWLSGSTGMFPDIFTQQTAETWIWTLHRSIPLSCREAVQKETVPKESVANGFNASSEDGDYDNLWGAGEDLYAKVVKKKKAQAVSVTVKPVEKKSRNLLVMRHGERCDFVFSRNWCDKCFDAKGKYTQTNLNLPRVMVKRKVHQDFQRDAPLTELGCWQARVTGEAIKNAGITISHIYASSALRCVQTAQEFIRGGDMTCKIHVEPTVFEWCGWYKPTLPNWLSAEELASAGFSVETSYAPYIAARNLNVQETVEDYYNRCTNFTKHVLRKHENDAGGSILIVGHAGTLDVCLRQLCGKPPRSSQEFHEILVQFPYCCLAMATEDYVSKRWSLKEPPIACLNHGGNKQFNWKILV